MIGLLTRIVSKIKRVRWRERFSYRLKNAWSYVGLDDVIALLLMIAGGLYYFDGPIPYHEVWQEFYKNIHNELIGIGASVLIIANAAEVVSRGREKKRLILQMGSPDNSFAREAVRQLRSRGWLTDGTTREVYLVGADLRKANLESADLSGANLVGADLRKANLVSADLSGADLKYAKLNEADLIGANLSGAKLVSIDLSRVNLALADLNEALLMEADLGGANLAFADLSETNLVKAGLSEAIYDEDTKWPEGFYPKEAGAKLLDNVIAGQKWAEENLSKLRGEDEQKQDE